MMTFAVALVAMLAGGVEAAAQGTFRSVIVNGQVTEGSAASGLAKAISTATSAAGEVAWVGYAVPMVAGHHHICCWSSDGSGCCGACALEPDRTRAAMPAADVAAAPVMLEPRHTLVVMARVEGGRVERIRTFSDDCRLDAGGRAVLWLTNVRPAESVRWLSSLVTASAERRIVSGALGATALHAEAAALDWLLGAARASDSAYVRGQALFWLSQRAGQRAVGTIADAVDRDPDTDVKKRAVFALSQLPADEGVPRLITIARGHSIKAVQKHAFFWLGQSNDPRALAFFADVLGR